MVYKEIKNETDPVDTKLWRDNFYLIPKRPPGKDYLPPLLPSEVGKPLKKVIVPNCKKSHFIISFISFICCYFKYHIYIFYIN